MKNAVCIVPVAPIRFLPGHREEMTSQLLFGESIKINAVDNNAWWQVECCSDGYTGFCRANQFLLLDEPLQEHNEYTGDWVDAIMVNGQKLMIPFGSNLSILKKNIPGYCIEFTGNIYTAGNALADEQTIIKIASLFLNTAYLWGGKSVFGIDCSGFVQSVYKMINSALPRDANLQVEKGEVIGFLQEAVCGDLAFFDDEFGNIIHVGILLNEQEIIHASGIVRIDKIDNEGIINGSSKKRTHHLRLIKRVGEVVIK